MITIPSVNVQMLQFYQRGAAELRARAAVTMSPSVFRDTIKSAMEYDRLAFVVAARIIGTNCPPRSAA